MVQKTFSFKYVLSFASRFHSRQTRTVKSLFFKLVEKYPFFKNKSVCTNFNLFASISLLVLNLCFAQETYDLEILFKRTNWEPDTIVYSYGYSMSTAGDLNQDGYDDIIYLVYYNNVGDKGYIFFGGAPMDTFPDIILTGEPGELGCVCSGDLNNDSISDIIIGQPSGGGGYGVVQIYFGGPTMDSLPDIKIHGENYASEFGVAVACGDVNGDSSDDLIIGAYAYDGFTLDGRVYVYYGGVLLDTFPDVIINGHNGEAFGKSVGSGGDLNSDGYEDIVVGADENSEAYPGAGKVYVFLGGDPMDTIPDCWLHGEGAMHYLGWQPVNLIPNALDIDRILVGTPFYPYGFPFYAPGKLYVLFGGTPPDTLVDWFKHGEDDSSSLGMASSSGGFESGDIFGEIVGGAPIGVTRYGKGSMWLGDSPLDSIYDAYLQGNNNYSGIGWVVACAGDVNGDGYDEVMFSNYAGVNPTVWVCRYTGQGITEQRAGNIGPSVEIYPNPFSELININFGRVQRAECMDVNIYDVAGKKVVVYEIKDKARVKLEIDTKDLSCGVYFLQVEADDGSVIKKVVKIK